MHLVTSGVTSNLCVTSWLNGRCAAECPSGVGAKHGGQAHQADESPEVVDTNLHAHPPKVHLMQLGLSQKLFPLQHGNDKGVRQCQQALCLTVVT